MASRLRRFVLLLAVAAVPLVAGGTASAAIGPPWCGTPEQDAAENLPTTGTGAFPHIPYYAIKCTLDEIQSRSIGGRMSVEQIGVSAQGRPMYLVKINALETEAQRVDFQNWQLIRKDALDNPQKAQRELARVGANFKIPIFIQGAIHGNEYEGVDADMLLIERLATTPYGSDPEVDAILDHVIVLINIDQNPDGRKLGQRQNGFNFDLNRDFLTQSQSETKASVSIMQEWLPADMNDQHGYVTPTLVEATTKPHNPGIDYDLWLKWNQSRIDANEAAMNAIGMAITRPINDWCADGNPPPASGICPAAVHLGRQSRKGGTTGVRSTRLCTCSSSASTAPRWRCATARAPAAVCRARPSTTRAAGSARALRSTPSPGRRCSSTLRIDRT